MKQKINYIAHLNNVNQKLYEADVNSTHIALYNALFQLWNGCGFESDLSINRNDVMKLSKIGSVNTYLKCLKELDSLDFISYKPSKNPLKGSIVNMFRFDTSDDIVMNKYSTSFDTSNDNSSDTLYKELNIENIKLLNKETIKLINDYYGVIDSNLKDWINSYLTKKEKEKKPAPKKEKEIEVIFPFDSEDFKSQWNQWKEYKLKEFRFKYKSEQSEQAALKELSNLSSNNEQTAIAIIHQSMAKGWQGLFKLKDNQIQKSDSTHRQSANDAVNKLFGVPKKSYVFSAERAMETILNQKPPEEK
jgi:hypothetical protein